MDPDRMISQAEVDTLCAAAGAVYYEIAAWHAVKTGSPVMIPDLLRPHGAVMRSHMFEDDVLEDAERFLVRLGMIAPRE